MKTTSKILLAVFALFIVSSSSVFAKKRGHSSSSDGRFSIGAELGLPMGNFSDFSNVGFGGSVRYEMPLQGNDNVALTGTVGYLTFSAKGSTSVASESVDMIPIMVGGKYYFTEQQNGFYFGVAIGITLTTVKASVTEPAIPAVPPYFPGSPAETISTSSSQTNFTFLPAVGYALPNWDFSVNYTDVTATGGSLAYIGVRVAYVLGGK